MIMLVDCNYVFMKTLSTTASLTNGALYGALNQLLKLHELAEHYKLGAKDTDGLRWVYCFDAKKQWRKELYPEYKANRKKNRDFIPTELDATAASAAGPDDFDLTGDANGADDDDVSAQDRTSAWWQDFFRQLEELKSLLKNIGCCVADGGEHDNKLEADDIIAMVASHAARSLNSQKVCIFSKDNDLWQLLSSKVWMCHLADATLEFVTDVDVMLEHDLCDISDWLEVKCIVGDTKDNIPGCPGVGVKTAVKFLNGELKRHAKAYQSILAWKLSEQYQLNRKLLELPYRGPTNFVIQSGWFMGSYSIGSFRDANVAAWNQLCLDLGMRSLSRV